MPAPLTLHLVRHGEVYNPQAVYYGRLPGYFLSQTGITQAQAAAQALSTQPIHAIYASPMERAQQTAGLIAEALGLEVQTDDRLNEAFTDYDGTPHTILEKKMFDIYTGNQPPYEMPSDLRRRLNGFITDIRQRHAGQAIVAVSHGDMIVAAFMFAHRQDPDDIGRNRLETLGLPERYPATASINTLLYSSEQPDEVPAYHYQRPY